MKELLFKALENRLLSKITANEFLVLFGSLCGMNDTNTFEHTFNIRQRTLERLRLHLYQLGLFDKDGRQYKLNVYNTQAFLQQFVDNDKIDVDSKDNDKIDVDSKDNDKIDVDSKDNDKIDVEDNDSENLASKDSENIACQNEPNDIPIELYGVDDKLSYMKNYFKELHSYPNGGEDWINALDALKEACGGFTECLTNFEVNLGEHTIKTKY